MIKKKSTQTVEEQYSEIIPELITLAGLSEKSGEIDPELYSRYDVKRGLRDLNGKGVLAGLTQISRITAKKLVDGQEVPDTGRLYYRGSAEQSSAAEFFGYSVFLPQFASQPLCQGHYHDCPQR